MRDPGPPRWLNDDEMAAWLDLVQLMIRMPDELDQQLQTDSGLSHFEYQVLALLSQSPEHTQRLSELARVVHSSLSRLSHVVSRLEKRGWVRRNRDSGNGRYTLAVLTDEGMAKVAATAPGHVEAVRRIVFDPLSEDQVHQLRAIAGQIIQALD